MYLKTIKTKNIYLMKNMINLDKTQQNLINYKRKFKIKCIQKKHYRQRGSNPSQSRGNIVTFH
jgi:hypothetical protein